MEILASVKNLTICYGSLVAVDDISFEACAGEILAVIGPNGSGKTSSIECLEGLRRATKGEVEVFGKNPFGNRAETYTKMGVQLQSANYPDKIKVRELCALFASFYEKPADWKQLLKDLGLEAKQKSYVSSLSGGEKQRLSVLLALMPRPKFLILDEITTGLDPKIRRNIWNSLKSIRDSGVGIIVVSHYMEEVEALADKVLFLQDGKAMYKGNLEGLRSYAKGVIEKESWNDALSLEDIYLLLLPDKDHISLEALL